MVLSLIGALGAAAIGGVATMASSASASKSQIAAQRQMTRDQALMNRWFAENTHQMEVRDLKKAGLNPVLSANGNTSTQSVSAGSASAPQSDFGSMASDINSAISNYIQSKAQASQQSLNSTQENLLNEEAKTEQFKRDNLFSQTVFNSLQSQGKQIENLYLPSNLKANLKKINNEAQAVLMNANANNVMAGASAKQAEYNMRRLPYQNMLDSTRVRHENIKSDNYGRFNFPFGLYFHD